MNFLIILNYVCFFSITYSMNKTAIKYVNYFKPFSILFEKHINNFSSPLASIRLKLNKILIGHFKPNRGVKRIIFHLTNSLTPN